MDGYQATPWVWDIHFMSYVSLCYVVYPWAKRDTFKKPLPSQNFKAEEAIQYNSKGLHVSCI